MPKRPGCSNGQSPKKMKAKQAPQPTVVLCAGSQCGHIELASDSDDLVHFCESCYDAVYSSAEGAADEIYW